MFGNKPKGKEYKIKELTDLDVYSMREETKYEIYDVTDGVNIYVCQKDTLKKAINTVKALRNYKPKERWLDEDDMMIEEL